MKTPTQWISGIKGYVDAPKILRRVMDSVDGRNGAGGLRLLNLVLPHVIPFNRPLGLKIRSLDENKAEVEIPFKRANKNHLGGLHACAIATVGEYTAGVMILKRMDPARQRLVLKNLNVEYLRQGRGTAVAVAEWPSETGGTKDEFRASNEALEVGIVTTIRSTDHKDLARVKTLWQVKPWDAVRGSKS